jgi:hypothetical protein
MATAADEVEEASAHVVVEQRQHAERPLLIHSATISPVKLAFKGFQPLSYPRNHLISPKSVGYIERGSL